MKIYANGSATQLTPHDLAKSEGPYGWSWFSCLVNWRLLCLLPFSDVKYVKETKWKLLSSEA